MRRFLQKALEKIDKMDREQIRSLVSHIAGENELLEMVLESMTAGVVVTDRQHHILLLNKSSERMIPLVQGDLLEKTVWETINDKEIAEFIKDKLRNQEKASYREFTLAYGFSKTLLLSIMPLVREGRIQGNLIHIEDITERRSEEARLRRAENLAALTTLTAGVAHEIKNPLASIGIHLQLIKKEMNGKRTIEAKKINQYLSIIKEEVDRLNKIVVDFLFTVRPMDTKLEINDLNQVIRELLDFLKYELAAEGINVELKLSEHIPRMCLDEKYMKQALLNIIKNAISAMPDGGTLTIETRQKGGDLLLRITDTGFGIPNEIMDKIFEPYFTTREFGSGLGLTLVYKIVKEHLGDISISSREGEGAAVSLSFPIPQKEKRLISYKEQVV